MPAGKHTYLVRNEDTLEYTMHTTLTDFRSEDPPVLLKELATKQIQRVFRKENSVFEPWKEDTDLMLQFAVETDLANSKINKAVKNPSELSKIYDLIGTHFAKLKLLFLQVSATSYFPTISQQSLEVFAEQYKLLDQNLKLSVLHVCFASAYVKPQKG